MHLDRCLPDVDTGGGVGGGGVSFVVVARSKRDGGEEQQQIRTGGWLAGWLREDCRATTDDNAPSPKMIRIIWEN